MYYSPFREDHNASMKVDYNQNLWIDYGTGEGGSIIDLVSRLGKCSIGEAIKRLEDKSFSFHGNNTNSLHEKERESVIRITNVVELNAPVLLDFLSKRSIDADIAREYCKEVYYSVDDKQYYGIGFQNISGGYEIRNPYFKGCIPPKDISHIQQIDRKNTCYLFEGFMDYLSFLTIRKKQDSQFPCSDWQDYIVLNSTANLPKALSRLAGYEKTHCFLDNDTAGRATYKELEKELDIRVHDASCHYSEYKDLNDYWQDKSNPKKQVGEDNVAAHFKRQIPMKKKGRGL